MSFYLEAKLILLSKCKLRYNMHKGKTSVIFPKEILSKVI